MFDATSDRPNRTQHNYMTCVYIAFQTELNEEYKGKEMTQPCLKSYLKYKERSSEGVSTFLREILKCF